MKKCPTCQKTFEDNLKFCQTDGTALVEDAPPLDPYQTIVVKPEDIGAPIPIEPITPSTKAQNVDDIVLDVPDDDDFGKVKNDDPLKTMVSSGSPFDNDDDLMKTAVVSEAERKEIFGEKSETSAPPPSPFDESSTKSSSVSPEIPKFSEPDLSPQSFDDKETSSSPPSGEEKTPPPISTPKSPPPPTLESPKSPSVPPNTPIPSPFDESMPPGYQTPENPPFKEAEAKFNDTPFGSPLNADAPEERQMQQQSDWMPSNVPNQQFDQSPPAGSGVEGENKTLAFVSLGLGILSIPCCGFILLGVGALITGFMARNKIAANPTQYGGANLALIGMILGGISTLIGILGNLLALLGVIPIPQL